MQRDALALVSANPSEADFTSAVSDIEALIALVGDGSGLILDPALDSFYLMDAVVVEFPSAQDSLGEIRALVLDIAQRGARGDDRVNLKVLSGAVARQLADHDIPILVNSMRALATGDLTSEARLSAQPLQITSRD